MSEEKEMMVESGPVWTGVAGLLITQMASMWKEERRAKRAEAKAAEDRAAAEEKASAERRRVMRQLRRIRPDRHCAARGCPLATAHPPQQQMPDNLRAISQAA